MRIRPVLAVCSAAAVVAGVAAALPGEAAAPSAPGSTSYVVTLSDGAATAAAARAAQQLGGAVGFVYDSALQGFSVRLPAQALPALQALPGVASVEPDAVVRADAVQTSPASYGLDRVDQRSLPLSGSYRYTATGSGVTAYVVDTGIRLSHRDFGGRAVSGFDAVDGGSATDCNGHGTHVAGTVGGTSAGVAKAVRLVAVRVLDCDGSGSISQVIAGLDYVARNHAAGTPAVANMSLGGGTSTALDRAVTGVVQDGVTVAVAAGNEGGLQGDLTGASDACNGSPSRVPSAITVGATTRTDERASYSNSGTCLDLFAPGSAITSDWYTSDTAKNTISGTSMATPHVAGAAALYLQSHRTASPASVDDALRTGATPGKVRDARAGSPNLLLYTRF